MGLTGCHSSWQDRVDSRPMLYGSLSDKFAYWTGGPCDSYRPAYHCGPPDGLLDRKAVHHASITSANQALDEQFSGGVSRDFRYGFQQAFLDIANGGSGALPAVPPSRYWTAAYRTTWGHNKAREWFEGYEAGANAAKCSALREAQSVPTAAYRGHDQQIAIGLDGGGSSMNTVPVGASPLPAPAAGWYPQGVTPYPISPYSSSPYSSTNPYQAGVPFSTNLTHAPPNQIPYAVPTQPSSLQPPSMNPWPQMQSPQNGFPAPGSALSPSVSPARGPLPTNPGPNNVIPNNGNLAPNYPASSPWSSLSAPTPSTTEGHSIAPGIPFSPEPATSTTTPGTSAPHSSGIPTSNPWSRFMGFGPNGFRSEGASR